MVNNILNSVLFGVAIGMAVYAVFVLTKLHLLVKEAERFLEELESEQ
jgi:hypothetical protein